MFWIVLTLLLINIGIFLYRRVFSPFHKKFDACIDTLGLPIVSFESNNQKFNFLVDTGSNLSHLKIGVAEKMKSRPITKGCQTVITTGNGVVKQHGYYIVELKSKYYTFNQEFEVMDLEDTFRDWGVNVDGILGVDFLMATGYKLNFNTLTMYL